MKKTKSVSIRQISEYLNHVGASFEICGKMEETVSGFSSLAHYREGTITWINSPKKDLDMPSFISICVVQKGVEIEAETKIISPDSKAVFFSILERFWGDGDENTAAIGEGSVIGENVQLGENVRIGCNCSIRGEIRIGSGTVIGDNVVIKNKVDIGCHCTIQSLSVIGEDGYGYSEDKSHIKTMVKHFGGVVIEDDVFIGNHTNIARGTIDDTIIRRGTKIAPSTLIAHNNDIGENVAIIGSELFGSVVVGDNAYITSSVIRNQRKVGNNAIVGMGSVVTKDVEANKVVIGAPARPIRENNGKEKL